MKGCPLCGAILSRYNVSPGYTFYSCETTGCHHADVLVVDGTTQDGLRIVEAATQPDFVTRAEFDELVRNIDMLSKTVANVLRSLDAVEKYLSSD